MQLVVSVGVQCHVGNERTENQDRVTRAATPFGDLFVVADGVGGYQGGAEAAQATVDGFVSYLNPHGNLNLADALQQAVRTISADLQQRSAGNPGRHGMGSTVVLAVIQGTTATYAHAGDSRAYLLRDRQLRQLTRDHSVMERLVSQGVLSPEQARQHPDASVLTRAIGSLSEISLDIAELALQPNDALLLCSDGLWAYAQHKEIEAVAASENLSASAVATALLNLALKGGGGDNVSIQFLRFKAVEAANRAKTTRGKSRATWPMVALASVLAVSSIGLYVKAHPRWDTDTDTTAVVTHPESTPATHTNDSTGGEEKKPTKPPTADSKPDSKKPVANRPKPSAGTPEAATAPPATTTPTPPAAKPEDASTSKPENGTATTEVKTPVTVIQGPDNSKADWADNLTKLTDVDASPLSGSKECLAQERSSATLFYSHDKKDAATRIQAELSLTQSAVVEMSQENLDKCGGAALIAMPAKPTIGKVIRGKAEQVGAEAEAAKDAAKEDIKNRVDSIKKKPPQNPPNTDQPNPDQQNPNPPNKDLQNPNQKNQRVEKPKTWVPRPSAYMRTPSLGAAKIT
jgi:serine/threonine protein phosphatase PrpC